MRVFLLDWAPNLVVVAYLQLIHVATSSDKNTGKKCYLLPLCVTGGIIKSLFVSTSIERLHY